MVDEDKSKVVETKVVEAWAKVHEALDAIDHEVPGGTCDCSLCYPLFKVEAQLLNYMEVTLPNERVWLDDETESV